MSSSCANKIYQQYNCTLDRFAKNGTSKSMPHFSAKSYVSIFWSLLVIIDEVLQHPYHSDRLRDQLAVWGREGWCYNFFPLPRLFPHLCSMTSLLLFCSFLQGDQLILTCSPVLFLSSCTSSLVSSCSTGLSPSLVTSLTVTTFPLPSTQFYDFPLR